MEPSDELSPALEAARRRRATLHEQLIEMEQAISSPAAGRTGDWAARVAKAMIELRDAWEQHILVTEKPDGLYEEITHRAPRLIGKIKRLQEEHGAIEGQISTTLGRLESGEVDAGWPLDACRDDLQRLLGGVVRHRQLGADLVWEAYNVDIGGPE
ncbi:MAG TPA: hypothetical protein VH989_08070 [Actinomycetota bacterium]|jgi:hypothetical protein